MIKRMIALLTVLVLFGCVFMTLFFAITGNPNFMGMLMITMVMPVILWLILFFYKQAKDRSNET